MSESLLIPTPDSVLNTMKLLFGGEATVDDGSGFPAEESICAVYIDDNDEPVAAALCDKGFCAYAGASLSMIPKSGAEEAVLGSEIPENLIDNLREVMNICAPLFMDDRSRHLRLGTVYRDYDEVPDAARSMISSASGPAFTVAIPRYGIGSLQMLIR